MKTNFHLWVKNTFLMFFLPLFFMSALFAQGDGPRSGLLAPAGVFGIATKYVNLSTNLSPATVLVKQADFDIQLFPISAFYTFKINKQFAQILGVVTPANAQLVLSSTATGIPDQVNTNGIVDGFIGNIHQLHYYQC